MQAFRRQQILTLVAEYAAEKYAPKPFAGKVPATAKVLDGADLNSLIDTVLDGWLTDGAETRLFEQSLAKQFGLRCAAYCNSGSSANLLALTALMQPELGEAALKPGDEVVTCAAGFPTTAAPIMQLGLVPVFVDCQLGTYVPSFESVVEAIQCKTAKAIMLAHTLGNVFDVGGFARYCNAVRLHDRPMLIGTGSKWIIEDCCDALGSEADERHVGFNSTFATCSFYPAHHITTGEGGAVLTDSPKLDKLVRSLRDWGRDCWCKTGCDNTCGKRFDWKFGPKFSGSAKNADSLIGGILAAEPEGLPYGFDHKYVYSRCGYNLKGTDLGAALGRSQLVKFPTFASARRRNFAQLHKSLEDLADRLIMPRATTNSDPCWFAFPLTVKPPLERRDVVQKLEAAGIATRPIMAGNLARQPFMQNAKYMCAEVLTNADTVMRDAFYVGCHHGLTEEAVAYTAEQIRKAVT
jgi:CDP-6-deoxy-D-xylo-4-hexulose-3-dehydrase